MESNPMRLRPQFSVPRSGPFPAPGEHLTRYGESSIKSASLES